MQTRDGVNQLVSVSHEMTEAELAVAEAIIARGKQTFVEVGEALLAIRDRSGYRLAGYSTFEAYCKQRWGWSRTHGYNVIAAAETARNVLPVIHSGTPPTLAQALALAPLPAAEQRAIVQDLGELDQYSTRQLRQVIKERRVQRVRDARLELLATAPPEPATAPDLLWIGQAEAGELPQQFRDTDLFVTSPPYGIGLEGSDLDDTPWSDYLADTRRWARELYGNAHPEHGRLCLNIPLDRSRGSREPVYGDWLQVLREAGWQYESTIVWKEGNVSNHQARGSVASPNAPHAVAPVEMILVMYRGAWNRGEPHRRSDIRELDWVDWLSTTWSFAGEHRYRVGHMAPYPEELPRRLIQLFSFPGDLVSDPFLGSGTTAIAALKLERRFCGSDVDEECVALARARVAQTITQDKATYHSSKTSHRETFSASGSVTPNEAASVYWRSEP
jgi:site-specific DNA-methyltransferase (adenine-specific)